MRKLSLFLLILFSVLFTVKTDAQYQSIFGKNHTSWNVRNLNTNMAQFYTTDSIRYISDTTFHNKNFKLFNTQDVDTNWSEESLFFLNEDTITGKVWIKLTPGGLLLNDTTQHLVCDMSLTQSDSFKIGTKNYAVDTIYYLLGKKHIQIDYKQGWFGTPCIDSLPKLLFIEGIGTNYSFYYLYSALFLNSRDFNTYTAYLLCSYKDSVNVYKENLLFNSCYNSCFFGTSVNENSITKEIKVNNPVGDFLVVSQENNYTIDEVNFYSIDGRLLLQKEFSERISVAELKPAVYLVEFVLSDNQKVIRKFQKL